MKKKVTCHCGEVELEVNFPEEGIGKVTRCNCSICKRKSAIMARVDQSELKVIKGKDKIKLYQYNTKIAQHYFCGNCGIYTHHIPRSAPDAYGINVGCIEGVDPLGLKDVNFFDGENHPLDQKK